MYKLQSAHSSTLLFVAPNTNIALDEWCTSLHLSAFYLKAFQSQKNSKVRLHKSFSCTHTHTHKENLAQIYFLIDATWQSRFSLERLRDYRTQPDSVMEHGWGNTWSEANSNATWLYVITYIVTCYVCISDYPNVLVFYTEHLEIQPWTFST